METPIKRKEARSLTQTVTLSRGLYSRVARKMKCDPSYVSRVARGERRSDRIAGALAAEAMRVYRRMAKAAMSR